MEQADQRRYKRIPYAETVLVNGAIRVLSHDISEGGLFIHLDKALLPGSVVSIQFPKNPLRFQAVVQVVPDAGGMGLMFEGMEDVHLSVLREIIAQAGARASVRYRARQTVLLVEEADSVRAVNRSKFSSEGFGVIEAADGLEAIKILHSQRPDAVVLELELKRIDGFGVMEFIRSAPELRDIPVVAVSSRVGIDEQHTVLKAGASVFLQKTSSSPAKLVSIIRKLLER